MICPDCPTLAALPLMNLEASSRRAPPLFRSYSLSEPPSTERYRISVRIEPKGIAGSYLREHLRVRDALDVSSPRGSFILQPGARPVVLLSAGIGVTPALSMLRALSEAHSSRQALWPQAARDGEHHPFAAEVHSRDRGRLRPSEDSSPLRVRRWP